MISKEIADRFANEWVNAWNSHDINRIMSHYAHEVVIVSPIAARLLGHAEVNGYQLVRDYFMKGLKAYPNLNFNLLDVLCGQESIVLYYVNQDGIRAGEFMRFDLAGKIVSMHAHYSERKAKR